MVYRHIGIRTAKFNLKNPIRPKDINKMQTAFPQSGIFPRSGMYTPSNFVITSALCTNECFFFLFFYFSGNTSTIAHLYGYVVAEL